MIVNDKNIHLDLKTSISKLVTLTLPHNLLLDIEQPRFKSSGQFSNDNHITIAQNKKIHQVNLGKPQMTYKSILEHRNNDFVKN